ncbi:MAG TPA: Fe-S cluster assembly protein HesB, partial [Bacteroidota bacterium]|nr:Fe-S cluster assembly protein HesB [Bacteroidota bacterium]
MKISFPVPEEFDFWRTVYSHGWCELPPFSVDKENHRFHRILRLENGKLVLVILSDEGSGRLTIEVQGIKLLTRTDRKEISTQIQSCFRLDEDYSEFYSEARKHKQFQWIPKIGAGRLLRAPTVFEDVVKMICTTNCSWALTETMVENFCKKLGYRLDL